MSNCNEKNITVKVVKFGIKEYPTGCNKSICCDQTIMGTYWRTPVLNINGTVDKYEYTAISNDDGTELPPTDDSYKIVKVNACLEIVEVVIDNAQTAAILAEACDLCCGDSPIIFNATIPAPIIEIKPCANADGDRIISVAVPAGGSLELSGTFNGTAGTPAPANPYASGAAIKTWLTANWSAYGVWAHDVTNNIISLTLDASVTSAGIQIVVP